MRKSEHAVEKATKAGLNEWVPLEFTFGQNRYELTPHSSGLLPVRHDRVDPTYDGSSAQDTLCEHHHSLF